MGNTSGQPADGFHLLSMLKLPLKFDSLSCMLFQILIGIENLTAHEIDCIDSATEFIILGVLVNGAIQSQRILLLSQSDAFSVLLNRNQMPGYKMPEYENNTDRDDEHYEHALKKSN